MMKTVVVSINGMMSVCDGLGVEKRLLSRAGIEKVEANFLSGMATVEYDESKVTLDDIKALVSECRYHCAGENVPQHIIKPSDPPEEHHAGKHEIRTQTMQPRLAERPSEPVPDMKRQK
jgi:Cu2+-exporting ATPase